MVNIVNVNVAQQQAPLPSTLQRSTALISQGATNTSPGTLSLLTLNADLTPLLTAAKTLSSITWLSSVATATTTAPHGFTTGDTLLVTIAGATPVGYNGTFTATVTGASAFTYPLTANPGSIVTAGVYTPEDVAELVAMVTTWFNQGTQTPVYVLELGADSPAATDGVAALSTWITNNSGIIYNYVIPRFWDGNSAFLTFLANFENTTSKTYFWITSTLATWQNYTALMKDAIVGIEAPSYGAWPANALTAITWSGGVITGTTTTAHGVLPGQYFTIAGVTPTGYNGTYLALGGTTGSTLVAAHAGTLAAETVLGTLVGSQYASAGSPVTEFSMAAFAWRATSYNPSNTNRVAPFAFGYLFGVTPFPTRGNAALLSTLKTANINVVGTGAEGGISNTMILWGVTMDGRDFTYWYSVDWVQINAALNVANEVINGSNNPTNPLYYDQHGIDRLEAKCAQTMNSAVSFGLALGKVTQLGFDTSAFSDALATGRYAGSIIVNAVPFVPYNVANPSHYRLGIYNGLSITYTPARGFISITINIVVTDFVAQ